MCTRSPIYRDNFFSYLRNPQTPRWLRNKRELPARTRVKAMGIGTALENTSGCVYLDYNATTPIFQEVSAAMQPFTFERFGNPSSGHVYGRATNVAVAEARLSVAQLLNTSPDNVFFTSCGTESDNWAIWGAVSRRRADAGPAAPPPHVVSSTIDHPAVLKMLEYLASAGLARYTLVPVDCEGRVDPADVQAAMEADTALVTIMHSNNEVGTIQPIAEIAVVAHAGGALMHTDAAQSIGKVDVDVAALGVDLATVVGHKFGAPKGVAALFVRRRADGSLPIDRLLHGGGQEAGFRAGTENVMLAVGLGAAARLARRELPEAAAHMRATRDALRRRATAAAEAAGVAVRVNGPRDASAALPNTLSISFDGVPAGSVLASLSEELAASAGAACHSGGTSVSSVLAAMQVPESQALGTFRLSTGRHTTDADIDAAAAALERALKAWRDGKLV